MFHKKRRVLLAALFQSWSAMVLLPVASADEPVRVGVISGLTGACADVCTGAANAIQLACEDWNAASSPKIQCIVEDDGADPRKGMVAYQKLRDLDGVNALVSVTSATLQAVAPHLRANPIPTVQVFLEGAPPQRDHIFQICPEVDAAEQALGEFVAKKYPGKIVVFSSSLDAVTRLLTSFKRGLGRDVLSIELPLDTTNVRSEVLRAVAQKPDAIMFITLPVHTKLIERELRRLKSTVPRIFDANFLTGLTEITSELKDLSNLYESPVLVMKMGDQERRSQWAARYRDRFGIEPAPYWEYSYDALKVLMEAYNPEGPLWVSALENTKHSGYSGEIEFDSVGATKPAWEIITVGELVKRERR